MNTKRFVIRIEQRDAPHIELVLLLVLFISEKQWDGKEKIKTPGLVIKI